MSLKYIKLLTFLIASLLFFCALSCGNSASIHWLTWAEWNEKAKLQNKKGLVWIYSPTCDDCKQMRSETLDNQVVAELINAHFHAVQLDVNHPDPITTKGQTWKYIPNLGGGGYHELAQGLTQSKEAISTPTTVFLDENFDLIVPIPQQLDAGEMELLLNFVATDAFQTMSVEAFKKTFKGKIKDNP